MDSHCFSNGLFLGSSRWVQASEHQWIMIPVMTLVLLAANRFAKKKISKGLT